VLDINIKTRDFEFTAHIFIYTDPIFQQCLLKVWKTIPFSVPVINSYPDY